MLVSLWIVSAQNAFAHVALTAGIGGVMGSIVKDEKPLKATGVAYGFALNWHPHFSGKPSFFSLGLTGKQMKLNYVENHINKRATYNLLGPSLGLFFPISETFIVQILGQYYPGANLSTLSTNSVQLNGSNFKYSTYELFTGPAAFEGRINFTTDKTDGQFNKKNRLRSGIGISFLQQQFAKEKVDISTSKDELTPTTTSTVSEVTHKTMIITIEYFLGLTF